MFRPRHAESEPLMTDSERRDADGPADGRNPRDEIQEASASSASSDTLPEGHPDAPIVVNSSSSQKNGTREGDNPTVRNNTNNEGVSGTLHVIEAPGENDSGTSTPRFIQDEGHWKRWKWIPYPARRVMKAIAKWSHGPPNAQPYHIRPILPIIQEYPIRLVDRFLPKEKQRFWVLFFYFSIWLVGFVLLRRESTLSTEIDGWGEPRDIGCGVTYWGPDNNCGVDGNNCRPFNGSGFPFRCPSTCESYHVLNPRAVGDQEVVYRSYVIGGPSTEDETIYRGDSFICGAAIHAGYITNANGGCGVVEVIGQHDNFASSTRNGIKSVGFDSYFPISFRFLEDVQCKAKDMRWAVLGFSAAFTGVLSLFTWSPAIFFFPNFTAIFWTVGMATDPPNHSSTPALFSTILGKFLPAMFCAWVMYDKMGVRRTLNGLTAQVEKSILWLGPCWVGALDNYTLSFIPINRLNAHDLQQQPGAKAALAIIIILLVVIFAMQVWFFRQEGRFLKYLKLYALFIGGIVISLLLPGVDLRIHHYILALLLLPGTSMQTRPSLIYQGLLIGLFINGIARWGFHSVLQTPDELRGDAQLGTELPVIPTPDIAMTNGTDQASNITITWDQPKHKEFDGISILVNDVERFRAYFDDAVGSEDSFTWSRDADMDLPEYFRFAYMDGSNSGDYTKAATWTSDGEWVKMKSGPSKIKARRTEETELIRATVRR